MAHTEPYGTWAEAEDWREESTEGRCERGGRLSELTYCGCCLLDTYRHEALQTSVLLGSVHHAVCAAMTHEVDPELIAATVERTLEESSCEGDAAEVYRPDVLELLLSDEEGRDAIASLLLGANMPDEQ